MDAAEAERIGERISRASRQRAERGEWHGGPVPPWGYVFSEVEGRRSLKLWPERAALVREAADRVLAGESLYRIRQDWNARGLTSSAGRPAMAVAGHQATARPRRSRRLQRTRG
jgi:site-specific DNA recombinase